MELTNKLLLKLVTESEFKVDNLVLALEDLNCEELPRFIAIMLELRKKSLKAGDKVFSKKKNMEITILNNNFVKDDIQYEYETKRFAREPEGNFTRNNTQVIKTEEYQYEVSVYCCGNSPYSVLF